MWEDDDATWGEHVTVESEGQISSGTLSEAPPTTDSN